MAFSKLVSHTTFFETFLGPKDWVPASNDQRAACARRPNDLSIMWPTTWLSLSHRRRLVHKLAITQAEAMQNIVIPWHVKQEAEVNNTSARLPEGSSLSASHAAVMCARPMPRIVKASYFGLGRSPNCITAGPPHVRIIFI